MDPSPYLAALSYRYRLKKLPGTELIQMWKVTKRGILPHEPFFLAVTDLFYLPENEHRIRAELQKMTFPLKNPLATPKVLVLLSYNGMGFGKEDDLTSFTDRALISYQLLEREERVWIGNDSFHAGDTQIPRKIRAILNGVEEQLKESL